MLLSGISHLHHRMKLDGVFPAPVDDAHAGFPGPVGVVDGFVVAGGVRTPLEGAHVEPLPHMVTYLGGENGELRGPDLFN